MTLWAVEGGAGVGKTHRLMERLGEVLQEHPLTDGQRVLALTFMHGSRRRLDDRLRQVQSTIPFAFYCATLDSFAYRIVRRWSALAAALDIPSAAADDYDAQCDAAAQLIERESVRAWVVARYPVIVVDEAQDLAPERLRIVQSLSMLAKTLVAADEFQCLEVALRPSLAVAWLRQASQSEVLSQSRRTENTDLLAAAAALRAGQTLKTGSNFRIVAAPGVPMAAATVASQVRWNSGASIATIAPSRASYVLGTVDRVTRMPCGTKKYGPYAIAWEDSQESVASRMLASHPLEKTNAYDDLLGALAEERENWVARDTAAWLRRQHAILGRQTFAQADVEAAVRRIVRNAMRYARSTPSGLHAMTVHQAKNREFDVVIVLWPYQVTGDAEQKRRLLYNAVTRARRKCVVIIQSEKMLQEPPFA